MEKKARKWEQMTLINELNQGRELASQLRNNLDTTSAETCEFLVGKILSSYEKALSVLNWNDSVGEPLVESPPSSPIGTSPRSEISYHDSKDQCHKNVFKKRKTMLPRWSEQVRICPGMGPESPLEDGYSWRKYGQKDILGAKFPRAYYRCTHRPTQGCLATKQVQKSDEDSSVVEITYRGRHSCIQASVGKEGRKQNNDQYQPQQEEQIQKQSMDISSNFGANGEVGISDELFPSFSFPSTPLEHENVESLLFGESMTENNFMGSYCPQFISPATSESNYFSLSPCHMNNFGLSHNFQSSDSDLTEIISAPTSVTNSPIGDLDFHPDLQFDIQELFA